MTNKSWLLAATLLSACALSAPGRSTESMGGDGKLQIQQLSTRKATYCGMHTCTVTVTVDSRCGVTVEPYALVVGGPRREVDVVWAISGDAEFARDGVFFKEVDGKKVFQLKESTSSKYVFRDYGDSGIYHYGVRVVQGGKECPSLDPTGINDM